jgi:hypothetical protein
MKLRFLLDENMAKDIVGALLRHNHEIDILRVCSEGAPARGALDPEILRFCEFEKRMLVTGNRKSMPRHVADHWRAGGHHWGVLKTRRKDTPIGVIATQLILMGEASEAEEYLDREEWISW